MWAWHMPLMLELGSGHITCFGQKDELEVLASSSEPTSQDMYLALLPLPGKKHAWPTGPKRRM